MNYKELMEEYGADDGNLYIDNPDNCPEPGCKGIIVVITDNNYGADADGRRGMKVQWKECDTCGEQPKEG